MAATKSRVAEEMKELDGIAWVTKGREIENYLSDEVLKKLYPNIATLQQYANIGDVLEQAKTGEGEEIRERQSTFRRTDDPLDDARKPQGKPRP